jgi:L-ascorbate metabolism protein UlaG (beta-lactamase superfamily)
MMQINWYGHSCFRLRDRNGTVVTDPYGDDIGYTLPRIRADVVTVTHDHPDHANVKAIKGNPQVIYGPGEYEIKGIFVIGIPAQPPETETKLGVRNTVYLFDFEGVTVCHLGDLSRVLTQSQIEEVGDVDVLLIPVGGGTTLGASEAAEVISLLEPRIVIPMHYKTEHLKGVKLAPVEHFLKEMGLKEVTPIDVLKVTESSLPEETQVMLMEVTGAGAAATEGTESD